MTSDGVNPDSATFVPLGTGAQQLTAVRRGDVDALALWDTQYQILANGGLRDGNLIGPPLRTSAAGADIPTYLAERSDGFPP